MMGVNSLPKTVSRWCHECDLNPGPSVPESSTLATRLLSHPPSMSCTIATLYNNLWMHALALDTIHGHVFNIWELAVCPWSLSGWTMTSKSNKASKQFSLGQSVLWVPFSAMHIWLSIKTQTNATKKLSFTWQPSKWSVNQKGKKTINWAV